MQVFWEKGYADTSMDDLVKATGVSRYGLYGTFGNKRELFIEALRRYGSLLLQQGFDGLSIDDASLPEIRECFASVLAIAAQQDAGRGCMICNTATEVAPHDELIAAAVRGLLKDLASRFAAVLANAKRKGEIRPDLDTDAAAFYLVGTLQGLAVMARAGFASSDAATYVDTALTTLN